MLNNKSCFWAKPSAKFFIVQRMTFLGCTAGAVADDRIIGGGVVFICRIVMVIIMIWESIVVAGRIAIWFGNQIGDWFGGWLAGNWGHDITVGLSLSQLESSPNCQLWLCVKLAASSKSDASSRHGAFFLQ